MRRVAFLLGFASFALAACGGGGVGTTAPTTTQTATSTLNATVMGGNSAISQSTVSLCVASTSIGTTNPSDINCSSSLGSGVTDVNGQVTISYNVPSSGLVYAIASGGDTGGGANPYIKLAAPVGAGSNIQSSVTLNEATTVALASVTSPQIGRTGINSSVLENAYHNANRFVSTQTGQFIASTQSSTGTATSAFAYLSNILSDCVQDSSQCSSVFASIKTDSSLSVNLTNTLEAAFAVLQHPAASYSALTIGATGPFGTVSAPSSFAPSLLTYGSAYYKTYMSPSYSAIDASGNVWIVSCGSGSNYAVTEMVAANDYAPQTIASSATSGSMLSIPIMPAIDGSGNVWISNSGSTSQYFITKITPSTGKLTTYNLPPNSNAATFDVAIDSSGNLWAQTYSGQGNSGSIAPYAAQISLANPSASTSAPTYQEGAAGSGPDAMTIDGNGNVWFADCTNNTIVELVKNGSTYTYNAYSIPGVLNPAGLAVDPSNNVWIANSDCGGGSANIMELPGGDPSSPVTFNTVTLTGQSSSYPIALASDSAGNIWSVDFGTNELLEIVNKGTNYSPIVVSSMPTGQSNPHGVSIDSNGNVWVTDNGNRSTYVGGGVVEFVGVAAPVKTPLIGSPQAP